MAFSNLRSKLRAGEKVYAAWLASGNAAIAEAVARSGFDAVVFDMQHGQGTLGETRDCIAATRLAGRPSGVRVGIDAYSDAARLLDMGAEIAIMPMVNSPGEAHRLADTLKYPPLGGRSWGPNRALGLLGMTVDEYRTAANAETIVLAMVETRAALDCFDDILATPGLDGVFVGPSDLSISLTDGATIDHKLPELIEVMTTIIAKARAQRRVTAVYCANGEMAAHYAALGFDMMCVGSDWAFLQEGARLALLKARGKAGEGGPTY